MLLCLLLLVVTYAHALNVQFTPNNPLRLIAEKAPKKQDPPICCLRPLPSNTSAEDDLISFEDWKEKHKANNSILPDANATVPPEDSPPEPSPPSDSSFTVESPLDSRHQPPPHFRIPLTDRFNYASLDCSARVHSAHRSAKASSHNILSNKKDKYMLSPCEEDTKKFVIVELCEDIRIDTVQLANYEFFSGVFKDFSVSVAKRYPTTDDGWTLAGTYQAKNLRNVQSFHLPTSLRDFYRYIRIDFYSHYGNEYYCPVSLLRVFGLTHLEDWKWELWENEYETKKPTFSVPTLDQSPQLSSVSSTVTGSGPGATESVLYDIPSSHVESRFSSQSHFYDTHTTNDDIPSTPLSSQYEPPSTDARPNIAPSESIPSHDSFIQSFASSSSSSQAESPTVSIVSRSPLNRRPASTTTVVTVSTQPASVSMYSSGESIFRTIMNRLTALEFNHTLYARYAQEQHLGVREALKRLTEDVGRLEGIGRAHTQSHERSLREWEKHRDRIDAEYYQLARKVDHLASEIVIEKWLSIAQMILLIAVFVFLGVTRGTEPRLPAQSVREWSKRHLSLTSFSGWQGRSRSVIELADAKAALDRVKKESPNGNLVDFPKSPECKQEPEDDQNLDHDHDNSSYFTPRKLRSRASSIRASASRSSSLFRRGITRRPMTPTTMSPLPPFVSPLIQAAAISQSISWPAGALAHPLTHKSAKKWARSAHLHPVKQREKDRERERMREEAKEVMKREADEGEGNEDWVDTDSEREDGRD